MKLSCIHEDCFGYPWSLDIHDDFVDISFFRVNETLCICQAVYFFSIFFTILPILLYCSTVWRPKDKRGIDLLRKAQRRFSRRVEFRCGLERRSLELVDIIDRFHKADLRVLRKIMKNDDCFDEFFELSYRNTRRGFSLAPKTRAATVKLEQGFAWRIVDLIRNGWCYYDICTVIFYSIYLLLYSNKSVSHQKYQVHEESQWLITLATSRRKVLTIKSFLAVCLALRCSSFLNCC